MKYLFSFCLALVSGFVSAQTFDAASKVNVFLGSSGDHGQMSPGASYPFSMMDICAQTYPNGHTGYENKAKLFLGFTHNRFEGVGCSGSGGNILITPVAGDGSSLIKKTELGFPGFYMVFFQNGMLARFAVFEKSGIEEYHFPSGQNGFTIDLSHTLANQFVNEEHVNGENAISGWIRSGTTCDAGIYKLYYYMSFDEPVILSDSAKSRVIVKMHNSDATIRIAFSSNSVADAKAAINKNSFDQIRDASTVGWNKVLSQVRVNGDPAEEKLFYSELYRVIQSPYVISEPDNANGINNSTGNSNSKINSNNGRHEEGQIYNGWSVWDNYKTQLPLLSILDSKRYQDIIHSLAGLYSSGKKNWATDHEPSNTVRTEHSIVVLLDAYRKGYSVDFNLILDSLLKETDSLKYNHPDKALESCYDAWAMSEILKNLQRNSSANRKQDSSSADRDHNSLSSSRNGNSLSANTDLDSLSAIYRNRALSWKSYWNKDFRDLTKDDVDDLPARGMYQGTIWQYRWFAPFDVKGLMELCGGEKEYIHQLDSFFGNDLYNASNEPDIQVPYMYSGTSEPWKSQAMIHQYAKDTVVQYYYNDNSRGIDPFIDRVFKNRPDAYIRTMDDDGGAMSGWYVLAAMGLSPACVGWPVWYLHVPLFKTVSFNYESGKPFTISVVNFGKDAKYIQSVTLNDKPLDRNWLKQEEIMAGGKLVITASDKPNKEFGVNDRWVSEMK